MLHQNKLEKNNAYHKRNKCMSVLILCVIMVFSRLPFGYLVNAGTDSSSADMYSDDTGNVYQDIDFGFTKEELALPKDMSENIGLANGSAVAPLSVEEEIQVEKAGALPVSYCGDAIKNALPPLRSQFPYGCCWSFSALGACEASLIQKGISANSIDLSERHLAYYFYYKGAETSDPLGGTKGDYNKNLSSRDHLNVGGNSLLTIWQLASWCGPVAEEKAPFSALTSAAVDKNGLCGNPNSTQMAYENDVCHLQNAYVISVGNSYEDEAQQNAVKQLIMQYGGLGMSYYSDSTSTYDNPENDCYYYDGPKSYSTNHAIMVVGWDDTFSRENFNEGHRPAGDGAWLMRNSWGEENKDKAQNGYFWLSYYDYGLRDSDGSTTKYAYVFDCEPADNYNHIYQHDGDAGHRRLGKGSTGYKLRGYANVFQAQGKPGYRESLEAVGIGCSSVDAAYTLQVYVDLKDENDPTSGTLMREQTGRILFNGYHTISLQEPLALEYGQSYSVVFTFADGAYVYASRNFEMSSTWGFVTQNNLHQSFAKAKAADAWLDMAENDTYDSCALRIKAYTKDTDETSTGVPTPTPDPEPNPEPEPDPDPNPNPDPDPTPNPNPTPTPNPNPNPDPTPNPTPRPNPEPDPDPNPNPAIVPAVLTGLSLNKTSVEVPAGELVELEATPSYDRKDATGWEVYWKSSDSSVATVNTCGEVQTKSAGKAVITVYNGDISASCDIYVLPQKQKAEITVNKDRITIRPATQAGADGYELFRSTKQTSGFRKYREAAAGNSLKFTVAAYGANKPFYYKLRAYDETDGQLRYGAFSKVYTVCPGQVEIVKTTAKRQAVTITWAKTARASKYLVYRSSKKQSGYKQMKQLHGVRNVRFTDKGLKKAKTYYYKIRASRMLNGREIYGAYSATLTVRVKKNGSIIIKY